jgi:LysR family transcriptional regulator, glycine cleavage system transcriptional activator
MSLRSLPPLAQLRAFAALTETGSMSGAGDLLNVSHAAISQQVRALEAHLGLQLTAREGRGLALTPDGAGLGQVLTDSFGAIAHEVEYLTGADAERPLQITTTPMFAAGWLMPRIGSFRQAHPDIDLMLNPTAARVALEPGGIDLGIRFGTGTWPGLEAELLFHTDFVIAAARSLIGARNVGRPDDLLEFPWLQEIGTTETNDWLRARGVTAGRVKSLTQMPGNLLLDGLRSGQGIVAVTRAFIEADLARGDVAVLFEDEERGYGYFLLHRPGVLRPAAKAFANWLRREARNG